MKSNAKICNDIFENIYKSRKNFRIESYYIESGAKY